MNELFLKIINMNISASWLILAVLILRIVLKKAPKRVNVLLWGIVAIKLICPFTIESSVSLIPDSVGSGELISKWTDDYIDDIDIYHPDSIYYDAAIGAGIENTVIPVLSIVWVVGMILLALYTAISYWRLRHKLDTAVRYENNIFQSENVNSPFVLGIVKPRIYLPFKLDEQNLNHVVAHEQAHILRKDHWWKPLGFLLLTIHWFNPLMWLAYILLCRDIELACDEKVIKELGNEQRADYSQALVTCSINRRIIAACPLAFGEVGVKERVKSVMNYKEPTFLVIILAVIACVSVAVCFLTNPKQENFSKEASQKIQFPSIEDETSKFYLTIGAEGVKSIELSMPNSSGGCENADGSLFKKGERIWLENLDGYTDLRGLTITAFGKNGEIIWATSIPDENENKSFIHLVNGDWEIINIK